MKNRKTCVLALCLALCIALTGCGRIDFAGYFQNLGNLLDGGSLTPMDEMSYSRPDMTQFDRQAEQHCADAKKQENLDALLQVIYEFNGLYDDFYTNYAYSMIRYAQDQTNRYWEAEYQFCVANSARVDAALDKFYRVLAQSSLRKELEDEDYFGVGFFDDFAGEGLYDEYFTALLNQEAALENTYYDLIAQAGAEFAYTQSFYDEYGWQMAELLVELVKVRQEQARYAGFDSYPEFAYTFFHARDYTVQQATGYLADIRAELTPLYKKLAQGVDVTLHSCSEKDTFQYVRRMACAMGGEIADAFSDMEDAGLYDITYSDNKLNASFEIYLTDYHSPFVFVNPTGTERDKLTFAHEFGHFCNDYFSGGSMAGVDVAEFFSQGMEYLSLCYGDADKNLIKLKIMESLCVYVEQAAYASFEHQLYALEGEQLTVEHIQSLYDSICTGYGVNGGWSYVLITHFFTEPMYVISYVVSNDAALQLYQMEKTQSGSGLACLRSNMTTNQIQFLAFLEEAGLESPFDPGRIQQVKDFAQGIFNG